MNENKNFEQKKFFENSPNFLKNHSHFPVLHREILQFFAPKNGQIFVDCTLGAGGHAALILEKIAPRGKLFAFEADAENAKIACENLQKFSEKNFQIFRTNFVEIENFIDFKVDGILYDLGISSMHIDDASRGFSFLRDGKLDMRFDRENQKLTAAEIVNFFDEKKLAEIFKNFGEERFFRKIAREICTARKSKKFETTVEFADFVAKVYPRKFTKNHAATKIFQALRIFVNSELENLSQSLQSAARVLKSNGKIAVISFHSLEDRIVKRFFKNLTRTCFCPPEKLKCNCDRIPKFKILTKKPLVPQNDELEINPRSRSAKLRIIEKI